MPEVLPAQMLLLISETPPEGPLPVLSALLIAGFVHIQQARIHQEGNLLDYRQGVGDTPRPELYPEFVDLAF